MKDIERIGSSTKHQNAYRREHGRNGEESHILWGFRWPGAIQHTLAVATDGQRTGDETHHNGACSKPRYCRNYSIRHKHGIEVEKEHT